MALQNTPGTLLLHSISSCILLSSQNSIPLKRRIRRSIIACWIRSEKTLYGASGDEGDWPVSFFRSFRAASYSCHVLKETLQRWNPGPLSISGAAPFPRLAASSGPETSSHGLQGRVAVSTAEPSSVRLKTWTVPSSATSSATTRDMGAGMTSSKDEMSGFIGCSIVKELS